MKTQNRVHKQIIVKTAPVQTANGHAHAKSGHPSALDHEIRIHAINYRKKNPLACDTVLKLIIRKAFPAISFTDGALNAHLGIVVETPERRVQDVAAVKTKAREWFDRIDQLEKSASQANTLCNLMFTKLDYQVDPNSQQAQINGGIFNLYWSVQKHLQQSVGNVRDFVFKNFISV